MATVKLFITLDTYHILKLERAQGIERIGVVGVGTTITKAGKEVKYVEVNEFFYS